MNNLKTQVSRLFLRILGILLELIKDNKSNNYTSTSGAFPCKAVQIFAGFMNPFHSPKK